MDLVLLHPNINTRCMSENGLLFMLRTMLKPNVTNEKPPENSNVPQADYSKWCERLDVQCANPSPQYSSICVVRAMLCAQFDNAKKYNTKSNEGKTEENNP